MQIVTGYLNVTTVLIALLFTLVLAFVGYQYYRRSTIDAARSAADVYKALVEGQERQLAAMREEINARDLQHRNQMTALQDYVKLLDKRVLRAELAEQRKDRLIATKDQEIEIMQEFIALAVPVLEHHAPDTKRRVQALLRKLADFRAKTREEQRLRDDTQDAMAAYLGEGPDLSAPVNAVNEMPKPNALARRRTKTGAKPQPDVSE